jgi:tRNA threonylcarbamoyladenosine biosynthesis protein TsaE
MMVDLVDESASQRVGAGLGRALTLQSGFVTFAGDLGAGKTTLIRAALRELGHAGPVRSPTYTLIESYVVSVGTIHHLDWYRLGDDEELESLGFRDLLQSNSSVLVEWPERIPAVAKRADLAVSLTYAGDGRRLSARALSRAGERLQQTWMTEIA